MGLKEFFFRKEEEPSKYQEDRREEQHAFDYNAVSEEAVDKVDTSYHEDKEEEEFRIKPDVSEEQDIEYKDVPVMKKTLDTRIPMRFFRPMNSNDIHDIMHYLRDAEPIVMLNISRIRNSTGMDYTKMLVSKVKQTLSLREGHMYMIDNDHILVLPKNVHMHKSKHKLEPEVPKKDKISYSSFN